MPVASALPSAYQRGEKEEPMTSLRPIKPLALPDDVKRATNFGKKPVSRWAAPESIFVDDEYQRDINRRSVALIRKIVENFAWRKIKPPIVVEVGGKLHCINGQHTAIAAATLGVPEIMVIVVEAEGTSQRADAFVSHNRDQLPMAPLDLYRAKLTSNDADALDVQKVCQLSGVKLRNISPQSKVAPGDCAAIGTISRVTKRRGVAKTRQILEALVKGGRAPISAAEIDAVESLMCSVESNITPFDLAPVIRKVGDWGLTEAIAQAHGEKKPVKLVLLAKYQSLLRKKAA